MPDNQGKYSLDELLRAKREERPNEAFWERFDRELKAKQRKLVQRQIVDDDALKSPFVNRFYRFAAVGGATAFAAFAVYLTIGTNEVATVADNGSQMQQQVPAKPTFTVAEHAPAAPQQTAPAAVAPLQEFATVTQTAKPRIVVERINPAPEAVQETRPKVEATAVAVSATPRNSASNAALDLNGLRLEFLNATGLFDDPTASAAEPSDDSVADVPSFEKAYALGKYADPLGDDFSRAFQTGLKQQTASLPTQAVSFAEIDDYLSNQGTRSAKSLDSVNLRF